MDHPLSYNGALVLQCITRGHHYGFDLMRVTGLPSGTVYPILRRLEHAGFLTSRWEDIDPAEEGRPQRRFYETTDDGRRTLAAAVERLAEQRRLFERPVPDRASQSG